MLDKEKILKHLDTMDRFPEDIDELENDIKQGRFDAKQIACRWHKEYIHGNSTVPYQLVAWNSDCGLYETLRYFYKFCPSCGKPIEEVRGE